LEKAVFKTWMNGTLKDVGLVTLMNWYCRNISEPPLIWHTVTFCTTLRNTSRAQCRYNPRTTR